MSLTDADAVSVLLPALGYPTSVVDVANRFESLTAWPDNVVLLAERGGDIVGICQVHGVKLLVSDGYAEIAALVVAQSHQRSGIGRALVSEAVRWATNAGYERIRLRSGVHRTEAHVFYEAIGFSKSRASYAFEYHVNQQC